jgi:thiamine-monophosphate kinase
LRAALADGEDFELLFAVSPAKAARLAGQWKRRFPALRLSCVGALAKRGVARGFGAARGYDHFASR